MSRRSHPPAPPVLLAGLVLLALHPVNAGAQGRWIDIGAGTAERIVAQNDPLTWEDLPPFAFGDWVEGNELFLEVRPIPCSMLPDPELCNGGSFVAAVDGAMPDTRCPCTGVLHREIEVQIHYEPARVSAIGARETDLKIVMWDSPTGEWFDMPGGSEVWPAQDVVRGRQSSHILQYYAVVAAGVTDAASWGEIKSLWRGR